MSISCKNLFTSIASLWWMKVNFLNQYPCISWPGIFKSCTFLCIALSESRCIFALRPSLSPCNFFFHVVYSFGFSVVISSFPYFVSKNFFPCHSIVGISCIFPNLLVDFFSLFWTLLFLFFLYCFTLSRYLFSRPSFTSNFWLFLALYCLFLLASLFFLFIRTYSSILPLSYNLCL